MNFRSTFTCLALSFLTGCSSIPPTLRGNFVDVAQAQAASPAFVGAEVRWGGVVVGTRESGRGECLEVAAFPLDGYYARPYTPYNLSYAALFRKDIADDYLTEAPRDNMPARFLACNAQRFDSKLDRVGAVLTLTGTLEPASVIDVVNDACTTPVEGVLFKRNEKIPNYVGTAHVSDDGRCVVSVPTIRTHAMFSWKEPPGSPGFH